MLLIDPIAMALHGYSVWFLEAGHTVLPKRLAMMLVRVEAGHTAVIIYQNSNVEQHFCGRIFFLLSVWSLKKRKKMLVQMQDGELSVFRIRTELLASYLIKVDARKNSSFTSSRCGTVKVLFSPIAHCQIHLCDKLTSLLQQLQTCQLHVWLVQTQVMIT